MRVSLFEIAEREEQTVQMALSAGEIGVSLPEQIGQVESVEDVVLDFDRAWPHRISLHTRGRAKVSIPCSRCLKDVEMTLPFAGEETFFEAEGVWSGDSEDPTSALSDGFLDVDELLLGQLLLEIPSKVLCRKDCKGLCPVCGQDLNVAECGCNRFVPDPRMQRLLDVFSEN